MCSQSPLPWFILLTQAAEASSCTEVARKLGVSRTSISLLLAGKYPGNTERMKKRIIAMFGGHICPQSGLRVDSSQCQRRRAEPMPTANPHVLHQWRECASCNYFNNSGEKHDC